MLSLKLLRVANSLRFLGWLSVAISLWNHLMLTASYRFNQHIHPHSCFHLSIPIIPICLITFHHSSSTIHFPFTYPISSHVHAIQAHDPLSSFPSLLINSISSCMNSQPFHNLILSPIHIYTTT